MNINFKSIGSSIARVATTTDVNDIGGATVVASKAIGNTTVIAGTVVANTTVSVARTIVSTPGAIFGKIRGNNTPEATEVVVFALPAASEKA